MLTVTTLNLNGIRSAASKGLEDWVAATAPDLLCVQELKAQGRTVFLITHRPGILAVADRILILRDGLVQADGPRDEVLAALRASQAAASAQGQTGGSALAVQPA